jgi:predicted transcriptional regulator
MIRLTTLKVRRMTLGLRQLDIVRATGIQPSRMSLIENEHVEPTEHELEAIERFLASVQQRSHDAQVLRSEVGPSP